MKFGKELVAQMVLEWQEAYINYSDLKTHLKEIQRNRAEESKSDLSESFRKRTLYRAFSGLIQRTNTHPLSPSSPDIENQQAHAIIVKRENCARYKTTFLMAAEKGAEDEVVFFEKLDEEFNKVEEFYKCKVEEVLKEAEMLNKQMDAFIAFRIKVENPQGWFDDDNGEMSVEIAALASHVAVSSAALAGSTPSPPRANRKVLQAMDVIEEGEMINDDEDDKKDEIKDQVGQQNKEKKTIINPRPHPPLEVLNNVKMNNTLETPRSTIKGVFNPPKNSELHFSKESLKKVERRLRQAFIVFNHKLRQLKSFSFLNTLAFSKIMKKYDKITSRNATKPYMKMVDASYLCSSDEVAKLMERVEKTFIKHFCNSNHRKGMKILRPKAKRERHRTTFSMGFFAGCVAALIVTLVLVIRVRKIMDEEGSTQYMETMFPLYSLFGFVVLHMLMYAANIYFWRRYRVNYSFIFGFKQGSELGYRDVLLPGFCLAVLAFGCVLLNLDMEMDPVTKDYEALTELLPLGLVLLVIVIVFCPFNVAYRSSRLFFIACLFHCICAPLYKVTLPDFFLADQLTSQVQAFRSLEFYICYYGWGDYKRRQNNCRTNDVYNTFYFIVAVIPYWTRLLQCLRRLIEEKDAHQGYNGLKYLSAIAAVSLRTAYSLNRGQNWNILAWIFSAIAAIFGTYWDLVMDWGLLQKKSENRWLRDKLLLPNRSVYFVAMALNVLLRLAWMQTVLNFQVSSLHSEGLKAVVASLEIFRRGIWNFFRLENEHLNNVGKYRAFISVPLPFNYEEDEEKDD